MTRKQRILTSIERFVPRAPRLPAPDDRRFLLWSITHLGDLVLQLPAATALKRARPGAHVALVVKRGFRPLAEMCPDVDEIFCYDARWSTRRGQLRDGPRQTARLRRHLAPFDVAFIFDFHPLSRLLLRSTRIPALVGYAPPESCLSLPLTARPQHRLEEGLALLTAAGIPADAAPPCLDIPEAVRAQAAERLRSAGWQGEPLVALCPGSGNPRKCWPVERYASVADHLSRNGQRVLLLGSEFDRPRADAVAARLPRAAVNLAGRTSIAELAALLSRSELVLVNDSGPMHLAAALGRPLLALFGPSDPDRWRPRGHGPSRLLRAPSGDIRDLDYNAVLRVLEEDIRISLRSPNVRLS